MKRKLSISLLVCVAIIAAVVLWLSLSDDGEAALRAMVSADRCPGYVVCAMESGREQWSCVGWADIESRRSMNERTVFRVCSMTKSLVGALAAVLADRGVIDLDEPVSRTFPEFTGEKAGITLRQCLSMTAGLAEMCQSILKNGVNGQRHEDVLREVANAPLKAPAGTGFIYSNPSFEVAAAVMVRKSGKTIEELLREVFFIPLDMAETTFHPTDKMLSRLSAVYRMYDEAPCVREKQTLVVRPPTPNGDGYEGACGGLFSTPADMLKFYKMLASRGMSETGVRVMSERALAMIGQKQTPPNVPTWYSFGFFKKNGWLGHGGAYGTIAECDMEKGRVRMAFTQVSGPLAKKMIRLWRKVEDESEDEVALSGLSIFDE